jgi:MYXO-CTERM domain-containing protein
MRLSNRFEKHVLVAAAVAMGATAAANAAIVYSGVVNFSCAVDLDGTYINVETGQLTNGPGAEVPGWDVNPYSTAGGMNFYNSTGGGQMRRPGVTTGTAGNLALGTVIGAAGSFNTSTGNVYGTTAATGLNGGWTYSSENIIGFKFVAASGATHYGWMRFLMGAIGSAGLGNNAPTRTVVDFGYQSVAGESIAAGAVPAPGALALLGVAGLAGKRRRR